MSSRLNKQEARRAGFKKAIDGDEARRKREDHQVEIRKAKREENLMKKRREAGGASAAAAAAAGAAGAVGAAVGDAPDSLIDSNVRGTDPAVLERLPEMVQGVMSANGTEQMQYTLEFRKLLSIERNPPIDQVIQQGVVPRFVEFLQCESLPQLQFEAAWALTNIASGTSAHTAVVMDAGAVPIFVRLLASPNDDVREQAVWALGNMAGDSPRCRDAVLAASALPPLLAQLTGNSKITMLRNATWTLSNLCRGKPQPDFEAVRPALATLAHLVYFDDDEVLTDAAWALSYLSDGNDVKIRAVVDSGVVKRLVELLLHPSVAVQTPALRTVGNVVTGDDVQTQVVINSSALPSLLSLLNSPKKSIRKEACWTVSNITAGNQEQIGAVIDAGLLPPLVELLLTAEFDIKKEAAWAISNATSGGSAEQIAALVSAGAIDPLCNLLDAQDARIISVALEGLDNILKVGERRREAADDAAHPNKYAEAVEAAGGLDKIEMLQQHANQDVYDKSVKLLEVYFGAAEETDVAGLQPATANGQFAFGVPGGEGAAAAPAGGFNFGAAPPFGGAAAEGGAPGAPFNFGAPPAGGGGNMQQ
ncbi:hypothetical protein I4F81_012023 [Pyropia yezoensis]|uniref:Uncharacterized protein n=1 Tax=Pyropia yezoensis TaxID=2788 RepID=A0ACC3CI54_PYRYE|nr:hypothetical protein I4F81_012023 [Neopyropia yezoensis]